MAIDASAAQMRSYLNAPIVVRGDLDFDLEMIREIWDILLHFDMAGARHIMGRQRSWEGGAEIRVNETTLKVVYLRDDGPHKS